MHTERLNYTPCRHAFWAAAESVGASVTSYQHPLLDPNGKELATDVAAIGNPDAEKVIVVSSGIHGVELPIGSQLQQQWLAYAKAADLTDKRLVFVHALNPYGSAYGLRNDENNVDVNRNFIPDFNNRPATSAGYYALRDAFEPPSLAPYAIANSWRQMLTYAAQHGISAFEKVLVAGQYDFSKGLYFGGREASWTRTTWEKIVSTHVISTNPAEIHHVDIHTGYGPYGAFQILPHDKYSSQSLASDGGVESSFPNHSGDILGFWPQLISGCSNVTVIPRAVEIGTSPIGGFDVMQAMLCRNALRFNHDDDYPGAQQTIDFMRDVFTPRDPLWQANAQQDGMNFFAIYMNAVLRADALQK
jgi:hypothetical protein